MYVRCCVRFFDVVDLSHRGLLVGTLVAMAVGTSVGCYVDDRPTTPPPLVGAAPPASVVPGGTPQEPTALAPGETVGGEVGTDAAVHAFVGRAGAQLRFEIDTAASGLRFCISPTGPHDCVWTDVPPSPTGEPAVVRTSLEGDGTYYVSLAAAASAPYRLTLACESQECRVECVQASQCPAGARCALIQCITTPCPSHCVADLPEPPAEEPAGDERRGAAGDTCGTRGVPPCADELFCDYPLTAGCGEADAPGRCAPRPNRCTRDYRPVCGCDGRTYPNACNAWSSGVAVRAQGECAGGATPGGPGTTTSHARGCVRGGCSGQLCVDEGEQAMSTCEMRPEYACYRDARCERQANGRCEFTQTDTLRACLANPPPLF